MTPRPYQVAALDALLAARRGGARRILLQLPTGGGKSMIGGVLLSKVVAGSGRVLVVAHRKEILDQFWGMLRSEFGIEAGMSRGYDPRFRPEAAVQLASIQTLIRRELPPADLVIVDEAHRVSADSYQAILSGYPKATIVGLTATPTRLDGSPLKEHFDALVQGPKYSELIDAGAIRAPRVFCPPPPSLSSVRTIAGDYHDGDLERVMGSSKIVGDIVDEWKSRAEGRRTVVFAVTIGHSMSICDRFLAAGITCAHLDGNTSEDEREQILVDLETGKLAVVCNVGVLTEGWDQPSVKCAVVARPTQSLTLWMQMSGRILRPWGELPPLLLDHAGNTTRHGLPHEDREWSLDGKSGGRTLGGGRVCPRCYAYVESFPCAFCGYEPAIPSEPAGRIRIVEAPGALVEVGQPSDPKRDYYDRAVEKARKRAWKPGAASARYKEKFGSWPPWEWSQATKREFEADSDWQARQKEAQRYRDERQDIQMQRSEKLEAMEPEEAFDVSDL